ncbi:dephospho-CoA kinase [[Mycoplasma] testudinis]|uniref:dephospho-CoA kinase n=1 Tax=[Mycoplasma] testudinis TaxID=33924 RepID=UPI0004894EA6|nr:dephospho-CoA kinase [[Mycoplasma] testudinis]
MLVCVTGLSGSGKSTILKSSLLSKYSVFHMDEIIHQLYQPDYPGYNIIKKTFGPGFITEQGVDRKKLGKLVFSNSVELAKLNQCLQPLISMILWSLNVQSNNKVYLVEIAASSFNLENYQRFFDASVLIKCDLKTIKKRLTQRFSHLSTQSQESLIYKFKEKDFQYVLCNNYSIDTAANELLSYLKTIKVKKSVKFIDKLKGFSF